VKPKQPLRSGRGASVKYAENRRILSIRFYSKTSGAIRSQKHTVGMIVHGRRILMFLCAKIVNRKLQMDAILARQFFRQSQDLRICFYIGKRRNNTMPTTPTPGALKAATEWLGDGRVHLPREIIMLPELIIAYTIACEAIGESNYGKQMVASVIVNRANERKLPPPEVCTQRKQFSCWNGFRTNAQIMRTIAKWRKVSPDEWGDCLLLAVQIQNELFVPVADSDHYYNPELCHPKWASKLKNVRVVGHHVFGRLD